jgi:quercetin dioxygenase-like cupin family protein
MIIIKKTELSTQGIPSNHHNMMGRKIIAPQDSKIIQAGIIKMQSNGKADLHSHDDAEQLFVVLKGQMVVKTRGINIILKTGDAAFIPAGEPHENYNILDKDTIYLIVTCKIQS